MKTADGLWKLSPSGLYTFLACKRCFWLEQHLGRPPSIPFRLNVAVDEKLKARYDSYRKTGKLPPEIADALDGFRLFPDQAQIDDWRARQAGLWYVNEPDGYQFHGMIDEILVDSRGRNCPADYKSSGDPPKFDKQKYYFLQMHAYALMLAAEGQTIGERAFLLHYFPEERTNPSLALKLTVHVDPVRLYLPVFRRAMREMVNLLEGELPPMTPGCEDCDWLSCHSRLIVSSNR